MKRETKFSPDKVYRYTLWRDWSDMFESKSKEGFAMFIGLNPSTADEKLNDPTIRRCIGFAKAWGYGALCMTNAFSLRQTNPKLMKKHSDPIGERHVLVRGKNREVNNAWLIKIAAKASLVVAAWGKGGKHMERDGQIKVLFKNYGVNLHYLGLNQDGTPKHPLYLAATTKPQPYVS